MRHDEFTTGLKAVAEALGMTGEPLRDYGWEQVADRAKLMRDAMEEASHQLALWAASDEGAGEDHGVNASVALIEALSGLMPLGSK